VRSNSNARSFFLSLQFRPQKVGFEFFSLPFGENDVPLQLFFEYGTLKIYGMKVLKFGGTSVGSVESILNLKKIVEGQDEAVVVVVSALGGITDKLINTSKLAVSGDASYLTAYEEMVERHHRMIDAIITGTERKQT
jgi:hypothetical protein